jgi:copper chaperone CopZ
VDSILVSASFLGWPFAVFRVLSAAVTGLAGGLLVDLLDGKRGAKEALSPAQESPAVRQPRLAGMFKHGLDIIRSIWLWIVVGILVSAAIEVFVPPSFLAGIGELGIVASAFIALAISLPLYVCATASVPIAAALVAGGLPPGAALVFLMAGPATNVATIGAVYRQFGGRVLAAYLGTIILGSTLAAVAFDWLVPAANALPAAAHHEHSAWWAEASAVLLLGLFAWFAVEKLTSWYRRGASQRRESGEVEVRFAVRGMKCGNCVARLEQSLRKAEGVRSAVVHLDPGEAIVRGAVDRGRIRETILQAGFQPE